MSWMDSILSDKFAFMRWLKEQLRVSLYTNAFYLMLNNIVSGILGFAFWIIVARCYNTSELGLASAIISVIGFLAILSNLGLGFGLIRFLPNANKKAIPMINTSLTIGGIASLVAMLIFLGGLGFWSPILLFIRQQPILLALFMSLGILSTLCGLTGQVFIAKRRAQYNFIQNTSVGLLQMLLVFTFAFIFGTFGILTSMVLAMLATLLMSTLWLLPKVQPGYLPIPVLHRLAVNKIMRFSISTYCAYLFWIAPTMVLPLIVMNNLGTEMNAYFYISWKVANVLYLIPVAIATSLFVEGSFLEDKLFSNILKALKLCTITIIPVVIISFLWGDKILLAFGTEYSESGFRLLRILIISVFPVTINTIYLSILRVRKEMGKLIGLSIATSIMVLSFAYFLMISAGLIGIGIGWLVAHSVIATVIILYMGMRWSPKFGQVVKSGFCS
ncbi:oligosaccharide flippase family protein [Chloroflexota bacterium]